ncbi:nucleoside:proton symporter [Methylosinus sp. H3A]|uniref:NupC/NupG family nucleoside CNT transporter n=1 Tax=Methylosinus sp. H3A TaxID=2785786 RepID=UPI0018C1DEC6|nr:nucleoside transporter C-terminal domain-containing protein [Methylosinus sp. H3A]MBG0809379.1 nucleoside:proton symporter [Methylosinus sp. H3A]
MADIARSLLAFLCFLLIAFALSDDRRRIPWRVVFGGLALQLAVALVLVHFPPARQAVLFANDAANALQTATEAGSGFVFGYLGGGPAPFEEKTPGAGFILAFKALPMVLTISALASLFFYWGVLQRIAGAFAFLLQRSMGLSGALALGAAVHIFVGMIEAPLLIRPYLGRMQRGELFALMSCGMAGVAGTVMVIYAGFVAPFLPDALGHILIASVIATPAAIAVAAVMSPWDVYKENAEAQLAIDHPPTGAFDAIVKGVADGVAPLVGIVSVLLTTIALVTLVNMALAHLPQIGGETPSLQLAFAYAFRPVAWLIGAPWSETPAAASLMATKTVVNEFVAYRDMSGLSAEALSPRSRLILTYALCGFANFGSMGILVGGLNAMLPGRRAEITRLGLRSILSGTLATCMSATVAGLLYND